MAGIPQCSEFIPQYFEEYFILIKDSQFESEAFSLKSLFLIKNLDFLFFKCIRLA